MWSRLRESNDLRENMKIIIEAQKINQWWKGCQGATV